MTETLQHAPQYITEAEQLLGTRAFFDSEREHALHDRTLLFSPETAGMRGLLYIRALRLIARASRESKFDINARDTSQQLGRFALENITEVLDISRKLAVINTAEHLLMEQEGVFLAGLRSEQQPYMRDIVGFMDTEPSFITYNTPTGEAQTYVQGALVEAPTGLGKSVLMARALVATGVGMPIERIKHDQKRVRALIIVPSQTLVEQLSGKIGDDTLRRFAPGVNVGAYYQHEQNSDADAVVITIEQFTRKFRNGMLDGQTFDICIIDEAHRATQPRFQKVLFEEWGDKPIIGFTATPHYDKKKDARRLLPHHIHHGDILEYIQNHTDVLNAAQLFEVRVEHDHYLSAELIKQTAEWSAKDIEQLVIREGTADFLTSQIQEGRRGIVFCEQGGGEPSGYAIKMAQRLSELTKPDGSQVRTAVAGTINAHLRADDPNSNQGIRRRYAAGELDFIVTVDWGREGLNEDIDTVITAGVITSRLKFMQEIGRGTRLSKRFPITTYAHIYTPTTNRNALSLFGLFGFETIEQGVIIGVKDDADNGGNVIPGQNDSNGASFEALNFSSTMMSILASIQAKTVGEALFSAESTLALPGDFVNFSQMMLHVPGPPVTIRKFLRDKLGYRSIGRYEPSADGRKFFFYFEPAANDYLKKFRGAVPRVSLQREFGNVDVTIIDGTAKEVGVKSFSWYYPDGKFIPHFSPEDADLIREAFHKIPPALPTDYNRPRLGAILGMSTSVLATWMLPGERELSVPKRARTQQGYLRVLDHWSEQDALRIIQRRNEQNEHGGVPLYLIQVERAARHAKTHRSTLTEFAASINEAAEIVRIAASGRPPRCITWKTLQLAEQRYGTRHTSFTIDYSRLPTDRLDRDEAKLQYAQEVRARLETLPPSPT